MLDKHPPTVKCNDCQEMFYKSCDLKVHIQVYHKSAKKYEYEKCEKKFVLKHRQIHEYHTSKKCH